MLDPFIGTLITILFYFVYVNFLIGGVRRNSVVDKGFLNERISGDFVKGKFEKGNYLFLLSGLGCGLLLFSFLYFFPSWTKMVENIQSDVGFLLYKLFIEIALFEETIKYVIFILTFLLLIKNKKWVFTTLSPYRSADHYFKYFCAVGVALGFATMENIFYVFSGLENVNSIFVRNTLPSVMHLICGSFMGLFFLSGTNENERNIWKKVGYNILALLVPIFIHGVYNYLVLNIEESWSIYVFLGILTVSNIPLLKHNNLIK